MRPARALGAPVLLALIVLAALANPAAAQRRNNGRNYAAMRQAMINQLQQQLTAARQTLSAAQAEIAQAQGKIDESKSRVVANRPIADQGKDIFSFGEDDTGDMYLLTSSIDGKSIYRFARTK